MKEKARIKQLLSPLEAICLPEFKYNTGGQINRDIRIMFPLKSLTQSSIRKLEEENKMLHSVRNGDITILSSHEDKLLMLLLLLCVPT